MREIVRADGRGLDLRNTWLNRTKVGDAWLYYLNIFDSGTAGQSYTVRFECSANPGNRTPDIGQVNDWIIRAGRMLGFVVRATDPDGTTPLLYTGMLPFGATFQDMRNVSGRFEWTPTAGQLGAYPIHIVASDGDLTSEKTVTVTVVDANSNHAPAAQDLDVTTAEDTPVSRKMTGYDPTATPSPSPWPPLSGPRRADGAEPGRRRRGLGGGGGPLLCLPGQLPGERGRGRRLRRDGQSQPVREGRRDPDAAVNPGPVKRRKHPAKRCCILCYVWRSNDVTPLRETNHGMGLFHIEGLTNE